MRKLQVAWRDDIYVRFAVQSQVAACCTADAHARFSVCLISASLDNEGSLVVALAPGWLVWR
jgi:hypothetical protein